MFNPDDILYEDNHLLIVNKRCGDLVQPDPSGESALEDQIKAFIKRRDAKPGEVFLGVVQTDGEILVVSQFTLQASTRKGNRPSYIKAAPEAVSRPLYERFTARVAELLGRGVATGEFGADMQVELVNDGPVTIWMDSKNKE